MSTGSAPDSPSAGVAARANVVRAGAIPRRRRGMPPGPETRASSRHSSGSTSRNPISNTRSLNRRCASPTPAPKKRPPQKIIAMRVNAVAAVTSRRRTPEAGAARRGSRVRPLQHFSPAAYRRPAGIQRREPARAGHIRPRGDGRRRSIRASRSSSYCRARPPPADAIDEMVFTARALAAQLGGGLADERGVPLTAACVLGRLREEALEFERSAGTA